MQISNKNTSIKLTQKSNDLIKRVQDKFEEILSQIHPGYEIVWDIEWNLFNRNNIRFNHWEIYDFFDKKIIAFKNWYIDIDTRKPIMINNHELCMIRRRTVLPSWEVVFEVEVKWRQIKIDKFMISETAEYKFEWNEILGFWDALILPNWDQVLRIFLTIENLRLITKENKIYKVPFEGAECEVCSLWGTETTPEWEKFRQATIIDKNWKKRQILITKYWIQRPSFTIFWKAFFMSWK